MMAIALKVIKKKWLGMLYFNGIGEPGISKTETTLIDSEATWQNTHQTSEYMRISM